MVKLKVKKVPPLLQVGPLSVGDAFADAAIRHAIFLDGFQTSEADRILAFMNDHLFPDLTSKIQWRLNRIASRGFDTSLSRTKGLQELRGAIRLEIERLARRFGREVRKSLIALAKSEAFWNEQTLQSVLPFELSTKLPPPSLLRSIVLARPFQGRVLREHVQDWKDYMKRSVLRQVQIGLAQGESVEDIVRRLVGTRANGFKDGVYGGARRHARTLVRTASTHVSAHAREEVARANSDIVKGVMLVATLDANTTDICASLDGRVFKIGEGLRPPFHFQCRTTITYVFKSWKDLGIDLTDPPPLTRAARDYNNDLREALPVRVPQTLKYPQWLRRQPIDVQNVVLGRGRAEIWRRGNLPIKKFVTPRLRPRTYAELLRLERQLT